MDTLTHGLLGALTLRSLPKRSENISLRELSTLAFVAAVFPDIDYLTFWIHPLQFLAEWHRAATHSFVMMPIWSVAIGYMAAIIVRSRWKWPIYSMVCAIAISVHILTDMITVYGTQIFSPISDYKSVIGTTFVIDGYFTGIVLAGLTGSVILTRVNYPYHRLYSTSILILLISYLLLQVYFRSVAFEYGNQYIKQHGLKNAVVHSLPQPFSPTFWKVIVESDKEYQVTFINVGPAAWHEKFTLFMVKILSGNSKSLTEATKNYLPVQDSVWARHEKIDSKDQEIISAWTHNEFTAFRKFAVFPVLYRKDSVVEGHCIWFTDLRYVYPVIQPPFRYGMCGRSDQWIPYRLKRYTHNNRIRL